MDASVDDGRRVCVERLAEFVADLLVENHRLRGTLHAIAWGDWADPRWCAGVAREALTDAA